MKFAFAPLLLALFVPAVLSSQQHHVGNRNPLLLGSRILDLQLTDSQGDSVSLSAVLKKRTAVVMFPPSRLSAAECETLRAATQKLSRSLAPLNIAILGITSDDPKACVPGEQMYSVAERQPDAAMLVDQDLTVRRVFGTGKDVLDAGRIIGETKLWAEGKATYLAQCARCHGADGKDESYPGTKSLSGIGNRHSEAKIDELTYLAGFVDLSSWSEAARQALATYVAGL